MVAANGHEHVAAMVSRAIAGDEMAFARIVAAHQDDLSRVAYVVTRDVDLAHEAVQDTWTICWRKLSGLRDPARLRPWLVAICANQARQLLRRARRRSVVEFDVARAGNDSPDADSWVGDLDLRNALARLSPDDRALLALRYVAGLDSTELAHYSGISPSGTRARLARLLAAFSDILLIFFLAWLLAFILSPVVGLLERAVPNLPRVFAVGLVYGGSIATMALGFGVAAVAPSVWAALPCVVVSGMGNGAASVCTIAADAGRLPPWPPGVLLCPDTAITRQ